MPEWENASVRGTRGTNWSLYTEMEHYSWLCYRVESRT